MFVGSVEMRPGTRTISECYRPTTAAASTRWGSSAPSESAACFSRKNSRHNFCKARPAPSSVWAIYLASTTHIFVAQAPWPFPHDKELSRPKAGSVKCWLSKLAAGAGRYAAVQGLNEEGT